MRHSRADGFVRAAGSTGSVQGVDSHHLFLKPLRAGMKSLQLMTALNHFRSIISPPSPHSFPTVFTSSEIRTDMTRVYVLMQ